MVPHCSTDWAERCLTSQFGWDAVLSLWYDRMTRPLQKSSTPVWKNASGQKNRKVNFFVLLHYFQHFGGLGIVGPLFHHTSSIKFTNVGEYYLNSIRKSWLPNRRWSASARDLWADTWSRAQKNPFHFFEKIKSNKLEKIKSNKLFYFYFFKKVKMSEDTRSTWRYCNTRATLGQGDQQADQDQGHGLNKSLKLMWRHAPRTRD